MRRGTLLLGLAFISPLTCAQPQSCVQATQRIQVPEQINLVEACQAPPAVFPKLSFRLSEDGTDIYRVEWPARKLTPADKRLQAHVDEHPRYPITVEALFVYQDEKNRTQQIRSFINSGSFAWYRGGYQPTNNLPADWTPVFSIKYAIYTFLINRRPDDVQLTRVRAYAPSNCYAYGTRCVNADKLDWESAPGFKSSEIGEFNNYSPQSLPTDSPLYRIAMLMTTKKAQSPQK